MERRSGMLFMVCGVANCSGGGQQLAGSSTVPGNWVAHSIIADFTAAFQIARK